MEATAHYTGSVTVPLGETIVQETTLTSVTAASNPTLYGQPVTFTATVGAAAGTPTGTVTFQDGGVVLGSGIAERGR